jgi:hypothetical protein
MKRFPAFAKLALILSFAIVVQGCSTSGAGRALGESVPLDFGRTANFADGLRVTFTHLVSDSRCPADVVCIQAGEAVIELTCTYRSESQVIQVSSNPGRNQTEVFGHVIQLLSVTSPGRQRSHAPIEYSVTLRVTAR